MEVLINDLTSVLGAGWEEARSNVMVMVYVPDTGIRQ